MPSYVMGSNNYGANIPPTGGMTMGHSLYAALNAGYDILGKQNTLDQTMNTAGWNQQAANAKNMASTTSDMNDTNANINTGAMFHQEHPWAANPADTLVNPQWRHPDQRDNSFFGGTPGTYAPSPQGQQPLTWAQHDAQMDPANHVAPPIGTQQPLPAPQPFQQPAPHPAPQPQPALGAAPNTLYDAIQHYGTQNGQGMPQYDDSMWGGV